MKHKKALGEVLKERRVELSLTQRALADQVGIKPSHVAYIESGRRKPSLALIERMATTLDLNRQELFILAHPEAEGMINNHSAATVTQEPKPQVGDAWHRFVNDRALLARYKVTPREIKALKQLSLLGYVLTPREFLAILTLVRTPTGE
ncbi:MAG: helix-turn-helix transcriptional regulator [Candidatus Binataceae bacterium]|nr:helix-turn-helix transcriptional regulator [Candidatus Binataceae bacterium]